MQGILSELGKAFAKGIVETFLAVLAIAVVALWRENQSERAGKEAALLKMSEMERRCAQEKEALAAENTEFIKATLERVQRLESEQGRRSTKRR